MAKEISRKQKLTTKQKRDMKFPTRNKALEMLKAGANPEETFINEKMNQMSRFTGHPNYHVRVEAWKRMGRPMPTDKDEAEKFLASLHIKPKEQMTEAQSMEGHASDPPQPIDVPSLVQDPDVSLTPAGEQALVEATQ
jgi:hypothetical protein